MKIMLKRSIVLLLTACILSGCRGNSAEPAYESEFSEVVSSSESGEETTEEPTSEDFEEEPESTSESTPIEYVEWDGTGTLKKNGAERFSKMQYFDGKTYVIDSDNTVLGEPLPAVARQTEDGLVEPDISYFYFVDNMFFYLEENEVTKDDYNTSDQCFDLYAQALDSGDVSLLVHGVDRPIYQDGILTYESYRPYFSVEEKEDVIIKQIDTKTGILINEVNLGKQASAFDYNNEYIFYYDNGRYHFYSFKTKQTTDVRLIKGFEYRLYYCNGNIYADISTDSTISLFAELYEQGEEVARIFPKKLPVDFYFSHEKVFYEEGRKVMEYDLETNELKCVCELGADQYGENNLYRVEESGGMVLLKEGSSGPEGGYPIIYLYEVKDGEKTLITDGFWTS